MRARHGVTLVELLAVLVLLSIVTAVVTVALRPPSPTHNDEVGPGSLRQAALLRRRPVFGIVTRDGQPHAVTAFPDGSLLADPPFGRGTERGSP